jgi:hypothetical protein
MKLTALLLFALRICLACGCYDPGVKAKLDHADVVFRARIVELRSSAPPAGITRGFADDTGASVVFRVLRVWKGDVKEKFTMPAIEETSACIGFWPSLMKVDNDLLVYARRLGGEEYITNVCGGHKLARDAVKDIFQLGPGRLPR